MKVNVKVKSRASSYHGPVVGNFRALWSLLTPVLPVCRPLPDCSVCFFGALA